MKEYIDIVKKILDEGVWKDNRTGVRTLAIAGAMFEHDMSNGFPLLTTKQMATKSIKVELEGFIKGITDKRWYQERGCHIWDEWCNPTKVQYGHDMETKRKMLEEPDLGPIYGFQWRHFNTEYKGLEHDYTGEGINQLKNVVDTIKKNPGDRRMIVSAWNPTHLHQQALPPCHYGFQVTIIDEKLNLLWNQRSVDTMLGLPFNIASYALLLHLLAKESGFEEGKLIGFLGDIHIYENHLNGAEEQISRELKSLCKIITEPFTSIFDWDHSQTRVEGYKGNHHPKIEFAIAV